MIQEIQGKKKGPSAMAEGSFRNRIVGLDKPDLTHSFYAMSFFLRRSLSWLEHI